MNYVPTSDHILLKPHDWPNGNRYPIAARQRNGRSRGDITVGFGGIQPSEDVAISGDNYAFVDIDSPSNDGRFALRTKDGSNLRYVIYIFGAASFEQIQIEVGFAWPDFTPPLVPNGAGFQFGTDGLLRFLNITTGVHWHSIFAHVGQEAISARLASSAAGAVFNPGYNFIFDATSFYFIDEVLGTYFKPWIELDGGVPNLLLDPT